MSSVNTSNISFSVHASVWPRRPRWQVHITIKSCITLTRQMPQHTWESAKHHIDLPMPLHEGRTVPFPSSPQGPRRDINRIVSSVLRDGSELLSRYLRNFFSMVNSSNIYDVRRATQPKVLMYARLYQNVLKQNGGRLALIMASCVEKTRHGRPMPSLHTCRPMV